MARVRTVLSPGGSFTVTGPISFAMHGSLRVPGRIFYLFYLLHFIVFLAERAPPARASLTRGPGGRICAEPGRGGEARAGGGPGYCSGRSAGFANRARRLQLSGVHPTPRPSGSRAGLHCTLCKPALCAAPAGSCRPRSAVRSALIDCNASSKYPDAGDLRGAPRRPPFPPCSNLDLIS